MAEENKWRPLIERHAQNREQPVRVIDLLDVLESDSLPMYVIADDGERYYIKVCHDRPSGYRIPACDPPGEAGLYMHRVMASEQILQRIGLKLGGPVPQVRLALIEQDFIDTNKNRFKLSSVPFDVNFTAGVCHASREVPELSGRLLFDFAREDNNPARFGAAGLLYGLGGVVGDHQFFYKQKTPRDVYSLDHGFSLGGAPIWGEASLVNTEPNPIQYDQIIMARCAITSADYAGALTALRNLTDDDIAEIVAAPPDDWTLDISSRVTLACYLRRRADELLRIL